MLPPLLPGQPLKIQPTGATCCVYITWPKAKGNNNNNHHYQSRQRRWRRLPDRDFAPVKLSQVLTAASGQEKLD